MSARQKSHFSPELFRFLRGLNKNNRRDWFIAHKEEWLAQARDPMLRFVAEVALRLPEISPHFLADPRPVGGSMFRIHRDVRFAKDKSPYKTHVAAHFPHLESENVHCPGFYLHLAPGEVFFGAGIWQPDGAALARIRAGIAADPRGWKRVAGATALAQRGLTVSGESLKRPPRGFDAEHPCVEDLKRKDFCVAATAGESEACAPEFLDWFLDRCRASTPYLQFLCTSLDVPF